MTIEPTVHTVPSSGAVIGGDHTSLWLNHTGVGRPSFLSAAPEEEDPCPDACTALPVARASAGWTGSAYHAVRLRKLNTAVAGAVSLRDP